MTLDSDRTARDRRALKRARALSRPTNDPALIGNGLGDGRMARARRFRDIVRGLLDGLQDEPPEAATNLCRRIATLSIALEDAENTLARGEPFNMATYSAAANTLKRLLEALAPYRRHTPSADMESLFPGLARRAEEAAADD
jgi:hypothetical protein